MNTGRWLILSLALNLALGAAALWSARRAPSGSSTFSSREITNRNIRVAARPQSAGPTGGTNTIEVNEPFHWSQLESEDYRIYAANLRGIGCPEPTVYDIVIADVRELFRRRLAELVNPVLPRFWELISNQESLEALVKEKQQQLEALQAERTALLSEILGPGLAGHEPAMEQAREEQRQARLTVLNFLPEEKIGRCLELEERYDRLRQASERQAWTNNQERVAEFKRLQDAQTAEMTSALSPDELAEYKLRNSRFVEQVRELPGFDAGPDELKQIVRLKEELAATAELKEPNVDTRIGQRGQAEKEMQETLKTQLGPERFAQYQRAQESRYQELYQLTSRFELPAQVAADVYDMQRQAEAEASRLASDTTLDGSRRQTLLQAIRTETERSLAEALGAKPFELYQSRYAQWLTDLGPKPGVEK
jgi:hypothetical protein